MTACAGAHAICSKSGGCCSPHARRCCEGSKAHDGQVRHAAVYRHTPARMLAVGRIKAACVWARDRCGTVSLHTQASLRRSDGFDCSRSLFGSLLPEPGMLLLLGQLSSRQAHFTFKINSTGENLLVIPFFYKSLKNIRSTGTVQARNCLL